MEKVIVIVGPTSSGKSTLAIQLARKFNGEVISADSRQTYRGMNLGTGKVTKKEMMGIPHHLLDIANPKYKFTVTQYRKLALKAIDTILKKKKTPILCGGTGFYIQAVINGITIPEVKPDWQLRKKLEKKTSENLFRKLEKLDLQRTKNIDKNNKRRLIRALEIILKTKQPVPKIQQNPLPYPVLLIGVQKNKEELKKLIAKRLTTRLKQGMVKEVGKLRKQGLSWKRLEEFGLEYKWIARFLQKKITKKEMIENLQKDIEGFARRQMTWFSRDKRIHWIKNLKETRSLIKEFLIS